MKDWLSIGKFAKQAGLSARTLRVYEEVGLIKSHARGQNRYRYYKQGQLELAFRIKKFRTLGFGLTEIKALLEADSTLNSDLLVQYLKERLQSIENEEESLASQKEQIDLILSSLNGTTTGLNPSERRYIMSHFEKISVVVTGIRDLEITADHIREHLRNAGCAPDVFVWTESFVIPEKKPYILIIPESLLRSERARAIMPDVVVIKNMSAFEPDIERAYLNLFSSVGPHMTTIFNADDRISVELAANEEIRKGRIFYFSKNSGLEDQIQEIGGVVSDGNEIKIFGFNLSKNQMKFKLNKALAFDEETALIASLAAVMDIGLDRTKIEPRIRDKDDGVPQNG